MKPVMISMEMTETEVESAVLPMKMQREKWPYGLRLCLTSQELDKLNLDPAEAFVGGIIHIHGLARITSISSNEMEGGEKCDRLELQIESMAVEGEDIENEQYEERMQSRRKALYDRS